MSKITSFYTSSVGRKMVVSLTGVFLLLFLVFHLTVNLFLFRQDAGESFNAYAEFLATYPLLRPIEIGLFLLFVIHAAITGWLWVLNRRARPERYAVNKSAEVSETGSTIMIVSGLVVLAFLVVHVNTFFVQSRFFHVEEAPTMYQRVAGAFANPLYVLFYLVALFFLAYHLRHGFQSALQTYGLRTAKYRRLVEAVGVIFWLFIPLGFALMPLYFLFRAH